MKQVMMQMLKDLAIAIVAVIILSQFVGISLNASITLVIKMYVGFGLYRIFHANELGLIQKGLLIFLLFTGGIFGTKCFDVDGVAVRSFLTLNGCLFAGLVLQTQRQSIAQTQRKESCAKDVVESNADETNP